MTPSDRVAVCPNEMVLVFPFHPLFTRPVPSTHLCFAEFASGSEGKPSIVRASRAFAASSR